MTTTTAYDPWVKEAVDLAIEAVRTPEGLASTGYPDEAAFADFLARRQGDLYVNADLVRTANRLRRALATEAREQILRNRGVAEVLFPSLSAGIGQADVEKRLDQIEALSLDKVGDNDLPQIAATLIKTWDLLAQTAREASTPLAPPVTAKKKVSPRTTSTGKKRVKPPVTYVQRYNAVEEALSVGVRIAVFQHWLAQPTAQGREVCRYYWAELNDNLLGWGATHGNPHTSAAVQAALADATAQAERLAQEESTRGGSRTVADFMPLVQGALTRFTEAFHADGTLATVFLTEPAELREYPGPWTPEALHFAAAWMYRASKATLRARDFVYLWTANAGGDPVETLANLTGFGEERTDEGAWRFDVCSNEPSPFASIDLMVPRGLYYSGNVLKKQEAMKAVLEAIKVAELEPPDNVSAFLLSAAEQQHGANGEGAALIPRADWGEIAQNFDPRDTYIPLDVLSAWANAALQVATSQELIAALFYEHTEATTTTARGHSTTQQWFSQLREFIIPPTDLTTESPERMDFWDPDVYAPKGPKSDGDYDVTGVVSFNEYDDELGAVPKYRPSRLRFVKLPLYTTIALRRLHEIQPNETPTSIGVLYNLAPVELVNLNPGTTFAVGDFVWVYSQVPLQALKTHSNYKKTYRNLLSERVRLLLGWLNNDYSMFAPSPYVTEGRLKKLYGDNWENEPWPEGYATMASAIGSEKVPDKRIKPVWTMGEMALICSVPGRGKLLPDDKAVELETLLANAVNPPSPTRLHTYVYAAKVKIQQTRSDARRDAYAGIFTKSFIDWLQMEANKAHRDAVVRAYNVRWRSYRVPDYSSRPMTPGLARIAANYKPPTTALDGTPWKQGDVLPTGYVQPYPFQNEAARRLVAEGGGLLAFDVGVGKCNRYSSLISTAWGLHPIGALFPKDSLDLAPGQDEILPAPKGLKVTALTRDGSMVWQPVKALYRQRIPDDEATYSLALRKRGANDEYTGAHPFLTLRDSKPKWTPLRELAVGDRVAVPASLPAPEVPTEIDPDLAVLLTWQLTDGDEAAAHEGEGRWLTAKVTQEERGVLIRLQCVFKRLFPGEESEIKVPNDGHTPYLKLCSEKYRTAAEAIGYPWGTLSADRRFPDCFLSLATPTLRRVLRAWFDAEGDVQGRGTIELPSASKFFLVQLRYMLLRFGIHGHLGSKEVVIQRGPTTYWRLTLTGEDAARFAVEIGSDKADKAARLATIPTLDRNPNIDGVPVHDVLTALKDAGVPLRRVLVSQPNPIPQIVSRERAEAVLARLEGLLDPHEHEQLRRRADTAPALGGHRIRASLDRILSAQTAIAKAHHDLDLRLSLDVRWDEVEAIEPGERGGYVYDITVDADHYFDANYVGGEGALLLHNTLCALLALGKARQEGAAKRCVIAVPNGITTKWLRDVRETYPDYRVEIIGQHYGAPIASNLNKGRLKQIRAQVQRKLWVARFKDAVKRWEDVKRGAAHTGNPVPTKFKLASAFLTEGTTWVWLNTASAYDENGERRTITKRGNVVPAPLGLLGDSQESTQVLAEAARELATKESEALVLNGSKKFIEAGKKVVAVDPASSRRIDPFIVPEPAPVTRPDSSTERAQKWDDFRRGRYDVVITPHTTFSDTLALDEGDVERHILESPAMLRSIESDLYKTVTTWDPTTRSNVKVAVNRAHQLQHELNSVIRDLTQSYVLKLKEDLPPPTFGLARFDSPFAAVFALWDPHFNRIITPSTTGFVYIDGTSIGREVGLVSVRGVRNHPHHVVLDTTGWKEPKNASGYKEYPAFFPNPVRDWTEYASARGWTSPMNIDLPVTLSQTVAVESTEGLALLRTNSNALGKSRPEFILFGREVVAIVGYTHYEAGQGGQDTIEVIRFPTGFTGELKIGRKSKPLAGSPATTTIPKGTVMRAALLARLPAGKTLEQYGADLERELTDPKAPFRREAAKAWIASKLKGSRRAADPASQALYTHTLGAPQHVTVVDHNGHKVELNHKLRRFLRELGVPTGANGRLQAHGHTTGLDSNNFTDDPYEQVFKGVVFAANVQQRYPDGVRVPFKFPAAVLQAGGTQQLNGAYLPLLFPVNPVVFQNTQRGMEAVANELGVPWDPNNTAEITGLGAPVNGPPLDNPGDRLVYAEYAAGVLAEVLNTPIHAAPSRLKSVVGDEEADFYQRITDLQNDHPGPYRVHVERNKTSGEPLRIHNYDLKTAPRFNTKNTAKIGKRLVSPIAAKAHALSLIPKAFDTLNGKELLWGEIGCDFLIVDEAHKYKNLYTPEKRGSLAGGQVEFLALNQSSKQAWQMEFRCTAVRQNGGRVLLLTATPATTSPVEFYNVMSYLGEPGVPDRTVFDPVSIRDPEEFITRYVEIADRIVAKPGGDPQEAKAAIRIQNLPEFRLIFDRYANRKTVNDSPHLRGLLVGEGRDGTWENISDPNDAYRKLGLFHPGNVVEGALADAQPGDRLQLKDGDSAGDYRIDHYDAQNDALVLEQVFPTERHPEDPGEWGVYSGSRVPIAPPTRKVLVGLSEEQYDRYAGYQSMLASREMRGMGNLLGAMSRTSAHLGLELLTSQIKGGFDLEIPEEEEEDSKGSRQTAKRQESKRFIAALRMALPLGPAGQLTPITEAMQVAGAIMDETGNDLRKDTLRLRKMPEEGGKRAILLAAPLNDDPTQFPAGRALPVIFSDPFLTRNPDRVYVELVMPFRPGRGKTPPYLVVWRAAILAKRLREILTGAQKQYQKALEKGTPATQPYYAVNTVLAELCLTGAGAAFDPSADRGAATKLIEVEAVRRLLGQPDVEPALLATRYRVPADVMEEARQTPAVAGSGPIGAPAFTPLPP